jgi:uncharacterized protein
VQTNGVLIDEDWCRFLAAERFGVGLSLDGPRDLHDAYRVGRGGQPSHAQALRAFRLLRQHRVSCDILCSVNAVNVGHPAGVYQFFRDLRVRYIGFLPVVRRDPGRPGGVSEHTVPADAYGRFLCTIFDPGSVSDSGRITIQMFEEAARTSSGQEPALCVFRRTCGDVPVLERTGDLYCCDHFVNEAHRVGHIAEQPLGELLDAERLRAFGRVKLEGLPRVCRVCEVRPMCHGGCPKDRFATAPDGEPGLNYLCAGFKRFFTHYLERQAAARRRGR